MRYTEQDIMDNMGLVYKIAHFMRPTHTNSLIDFDDLVSEGTLGLLDALDKYDPEKGAKFSTYARFRIRGRIMDAYRKSFWRKRSHLRQGLPAPGYVYLDTSANEDGELLHDLVLGKFLSEQDLINRVDVKMVWDKVWRRLTPREKEVVDLLRSGLSQREVADVLGITASRVSQIYRDALIRLREYHSKPRR